MASLFVVVGLVLLVGGAELLVRGGGHLALAFRVPALIVGLTVVAFGTSAPELAVSLSAALSSGTAAVADGAGASGGTEAALANVTGSNIANILLVLGVAALVRPLLVDRGLIKRELPALLLLQLMVPILCLDGAIQRYDGLVLVAIGVVYNGVLIRQALRDRDDAIAADFDDAVLEQPRWVRDIGLLVGGLLVLVLGAQLFVYGAFDIAVWLGFSERFIGLTVIALGTSAPELVTGAVSAYRGEVELALGNSIGSNILNIAMVLGLTAIIQPILFQDGAVWIDFAVANLCTLLLVGFVLTSGRIGRVTGGIMLAAYVSYLIFSHG